MFRRWLIRVSCLLALAFVVGVWITSYFGGLQIDKDLRNRHWNFMSVEGLGCVHVNQDGSALSDGSIGFAFLPRLTASNWQWKQMSPDFWGGRIVRIDDEFIVLFPIWLPALSLAGLNWFVWRKTRGKSNGRGFPVEAAAETKA